MEKEIHFPEKKVDDSWKESVSRAGSREPEATEVTPTAFSTFVSSLGIQALVHMGDLKAPGVEQAEVDLAAAQEIIDILLMLKAKTKGNLVSEEDKLLVSLITDLQMKFVQHKMKI